MKTSDAATHRGLESHSLRHFSFHYNEMITSTRRNTQAGRRGAPAKGVGRATVARVQIPLSPPNKKAPRLGCFFVWQRGISVPPSDGWPREGDVCERARWAKKRAKRSSRGRRLASGGSPRRQSRAPQWGIRTTIFNSETTKRGKQDRCKKSERARWAYGISHKAVFSFSSDSITCNAYALIPSITS